MGARAWPARPRVPSKGRRPAHRALRIASPGRQGHTTCAADVLLRPNSTEELAAAVKATAARAGAERRALKMRATRQG